MDENKFRSCKPLLIDDDNNNKIFISEKNKYCIRNYNKSIHIKILNKFKDIKKSHKINVNDITDNYYKINKHNIIKPCTILLIDEDDHSKIFISEKNLYFTSKDCNHFGVDIDNYENYDYFDDIMNLLMRIMVIMIMIMMMMIIIMIMIIINCITKSLLIILNV